MKNITKLGAAALLAGAAIFPALNANAVDHIADFTLQTAPVLASVASTSNTLFGNVTIPASGKDDATKTPETNGKVTISGGVQGTSYTLTVGSATCLDRDSTSGNVVTLVPSAVYRNITVNGGASGDITFDTGTADITMGGTLTVKAGAKAGNGTCTYDVTIAAAGGQSAGGQE